MPYAGTREERLRKQREYWNKNKDVLNQKQRKYWNKNKDILNRKQREYWNKNKDKLNKQRREKRKTDNGYTINRQRTYYRENKDRVNVRRKGYREINRDKINKQLMARYYKDHKKSLEYKQEYTKKWREKLRLQIIEHYSEGKNRCELCGETDIDVLTIDHIGGGGHQHRKKVGGHIDWILVSQNFPEGYRILCMNCQMIEKKRKNQYKPPNRINFTQTVSMLSQLGYVFKENLRFIIKLR